MGRRRPAHVRASVGRRPTRCSRAGSCPASSTCTATSAWRPTARSTTRTARGAGAGRPGLRRPAGARRRLAGGHRLGARAGRPAAADPRGSAPGAAQAVPAALRPRARRPSTSCRRPCARRPRAATAGSSSSPTGSTATSDADGDLRPLWSARRAGRRRRRRPRGGRARHGPHVRRRSRLDALLDAGVDCLEHATGATPDQIDRIAAAGIPVTATLLQVAQFEAIAAQGSALPACSPRACAALHAHRYELVRDLHDAGVPVLVGTDAGGTIAHGRIADEAAEMVRAGHPRAGRRRSRELADARVARRRRASPRARAPTSSSTTRTRASTSRCSRGPRAVVLRGDGRRRPVGDRGTRARTGLGAVGHVWHNGRLYSGLQPLYLRSPCPRPHRRAHPTGNARRRHLSRHQEKTTPWPPRSVSSVSARSARRTTASSSPTRAPSATVA